MSYIKEIIECFFYHDISENLRGRVYNRILHPVDSHERDEAMKQLWDGIDAKESSDWKVAYRKVKAGIYKDDKKVSRIKPLWRWTGIAAMWLVPFIMLCVSGYLYINGKDTETTKVSYVQYYAGYGKREQVTLPDGSNVWLNSGSTLICPSTFALEERGVYLLGEGFFDVAKDKEHPFVVNTNYLKMQVLGTTFNVSAYPNSAQVKTTLETGSLKVSVQNDTTVSYCMTPGDILVYTPSDNKMERFKVQNVSDYSDWRTGGLFFNNTSFEDAMHAIERCYGVNIHIRTSVYNAQKIHVHYNKNESLENIFRIFKLMIPDLEYKISENAVYIE